MNNKLIKYFFDITFFHIISVFLCYSQISNERSPEERFFPVQFFYEAVSLPSTDTSKSLVEVFTSVSYEFLTFIKNNEPLQNNFTGNIDITIEIFDKKMNSVKREIFQKGITLSEQELKQLKDRFINACFEIEIRPETYNIFIEISDKESQKIIKKEIKPFVVKSFKNTLSDIILLSENEKIIPINRSGNIPFGKNAVVSLEISDKRTDADSLTFQVYKIDESEKRKIIDKKITKDKIIEYFSLQHDSKYSENYSLKSDKNKSFLKIPFQSDTLDIGKYEILITSKNNLSTEIAKKAFDIVWYDMPRSLIDFQDAQSKLKIILSESGYKEIQAGSKKEQREKFLSYWKRKDPTPSTSFNEVMNEYYKRVDYAMINFSTLKEIDGANTDRGKTYILYGNPDSKNRELLPNSPPKEEWIYKLIKKKFVFIDEFKNGVYKLISTENI